MIPAKLRAISHTPLTTLWPPGYDCLTVKRSLDWAVSWNLLCSYLVVSARLGQDTPSDRCPQLAGQVVNNRWGRTLNACHLMYQWPTYTATDGYLLMLVYSQNPRLEGATQICLIAGRGFYKGLDGPGTLAHWLKRKQMLRRRYCFYGIAFQASQGVDLKDFNASGADEKQSMKAILLTVFLESFVN